MRAYQLTFPECEIEYPPIFVSTHTSESKYAILADDDKGETPACKPGDIVMDSHTGDLWLLKHRDFWVTRGGEWFGELERKIGSSDTYCGALFKSKILHEERN